MTEVEGQLPLWEWPVKRILLTGSRTWKDERKLKATLEMFRHTGATLVHGGCPTGADQQGEMIWARDWGLPTEVHKADWSHGPKGGPVRNSKMVNLGADVCVAFIRDASPGAVDTVLKAKKAGIKVHLCAVGKSADWVHDSVKGAA